MLVFYKVNWEVPTVNFLNEENNQKLAGYLHEKRIEQNLTLDDISNKIGVPIQHLKNIEAGNFEEYDTFYLKMYLKKYASSLALNIDELYQHFYEEEVVPEKEFKLKKPSHKKVKPQNTEEAPNKVDSDSRKKVVAQKKLASRPKYNIGKIIALMCAVLIIMLGITYAIDMFRSMGNNEGNQTPEIVNPNVTDEDNGEPENEENNDNQDQEIEEETPIEELELEPETQVSLLSHEGRIQTFEVITEAEAAEIEISFSGDCWVGTSADAPVALGSGATLTAGGYTYVNGDEETITVNESGTLSLNFGNIQVMEMTINGEPVEIATAGLTQQWIVINTTIGVE